jgi:2-polyprenyl-3-methyl-5-hydroxy-6-metoxy-1,4-benzoquinol methylase
MSATAPSGVDDARFGFGANWASFAARMPPERIEAARTSLAEMLGRDSLAGNTFLDVGSGSGLFSLAAAQLGSDRVHSLDYDAQSVATTEGLRRSFAPDANWTAERGDALDPAYMAALGEWDVVYSWGVLHHTGALWDALALTIDRVRSGGTLFIAIYNDQGPKSRAWTLVKRIYNRLPDPLRRAYLLAFMVPLELKQILVHLLRRQPREYIRRWRSAAYYERGMSYWHDIVDWIGGYPFEVAAPEEVFDFCRERGFALRRLRTAGGSHGLNEFVLERVGDAPPA